MVFTKDKSKVKSSYTRKKEHYNEQKHINCYVLEKYNRELIYTN